MQVYGYSANINTTRSWLEVVSRGDHGFAEVIRFIHFTEKFHFILLHYLFVVFVEAVNLSCYFGGPWALFSRLESKEPVKLRSKVSASKKTLFLLCDKIVAMSRAASTLLSSRKAGEVERACPRSLADSASP